MNGWRGAIALVAALALPAAAGHSLQGPLLTIDPASLQRLQADHRPLTLVDVRPAERYANGRLPGARSIPLEALTRRHGEIPGATLVVLYGADGVDEAATAARYLRTAGHPDVFVLEGGFTGWQARGLGVEP